MRNWKHARPIGKFATRYERQKFVPHASTFSDSNPPVANSFFLPICAVALEVTRQADFDFAIGRIYRHPAEPETPRSERLQALRRKSARRKNSRLADCCRRKSTHGGQIFGTRGEWRVCQSGAPVSYSSTACYQHQLMSASSLIFNSVVCNIQRLFSCHRQLV